MNIYEHFHRMIDEVDQPTVVEVGVHTGTSTVNLRACAAASGKLLGWIGFEPDPRNAKRCREIGLEVVEAAASDENGAAYLLLSDGITPGYAGRRHTDSSSLQMPTGHLRKHPWCKFSRKTLVRTVRLDDAVPDDELVTLLWADVQGAQRKVLAGARKLLNRTSYLYIECHKQPLYEGEPTFDELCGLLPEWQVVERWNDDVLFQNKGKA